MSRARRMHRTKTEVKGGRSTNARLRLAMDRGAWGAAIDRPVSAAPGRESTTPHRASSTRRTRGRPSWARLFDRTTGLPAPAGRAGSWSPRPGSDSGDDALDGGLRASLSHHAAAGPFDREGQPPVRGNRPPSGCLANGRRDRGCRVRGADRRMENRGHRGARVGPAGVRGIPRSPARDPADAHVEWSRRGAGGRAARVARS